MLCQETIHDDIMTFGDRTPRISDRARAELVLSVLVFGSLASLLLAFGPVGLMG